MTDLEVSKRGLLGGIGVFGLGMLVGTGSASADHGGHHIVGTSTPSAADAAKRRADSVHRELDFGDIGKAVAGKFSSAALDELDRNPNVRYIEKDGTMEAIAVDSDDAEVPWGVDRVDAEVVHAEGATGLGSDIAVLDTGIDSNHPDLQGNLGVGRAVVKADSSYDEDWDDDNGHGTHCAGIADAVDNADGVVGVSTEATLHAAKVLDDSGSGYYSDVAAGLEWAADSGHDVASMSIGGPTSSTIEDACRYASDRGVLLVAAAGNDDSDVENTAPATYSTVVAVSATDDTDRLASFSNYGTDIELSAPGVDIVSTYPGGRYTSLSGTSMACPHVSGAAGQLMAQGSDNTEARQRLRETAEDIGLSGDSQGAGLLDVEAAVGGSTDDAPTVSWVSPTADETLSGTVTVQVDATDSEDADDSLDVTYAVDGGTDRSTTYNETTGYYEDTWDTTSVSDGEYSLQATATDSASNTSSASVTVTADNTERVPTVGSLALSETETDSEDAAFDAAWEVGDSDGNLATVDLVLTQDSDGTTETTESVAVSGDNASGTTRLTASGDDGSGNSYTVELTVADTADNTDSDTANATESEPTNSAPSIDTVDVEDDSNPAWSRFSVDWVVSDSDGDLQSVVTELLGGSGAVLDSVSSSVSGTDSSGTHDVRSKKSVAEIRLTVSDDSDATTETKSV